MTTYQIPQQDGEFTPEEAEAILSALDDSTNHAGHAEYGPRALKFTQNIVQDWASYMRPLFRRWRAIYHMLSGNTLERGGPEDIHVPELYKAMETIIPRIEEAVLEKDPWFKVIPRRQKYKELADTNAAYLDWLFDQGKMRDTVQAAARNMLVSQAAVWYVQWENREELRRVREEQRDWVDGKLRRSVKVTPKKQIVYSGPVYTLVDPFDFIIDTKATNPQKATFVGHRVWLTVDEIRRLGKKFGWVNLDDLEKSAGAQSELQTRYYSWPRDPTANVSMDQNHRAHNDGRPDKVEVLILYSKFDLFNNGEYADYQFVVSGGKTIHEVKRNQHEGDLRPYGVARSNKNGHEFYSVGTFDNAVRINQHLDRVHQIFIRTADVAGSPMVFAEEDSDLPDSLYRVKPFSVFKGVGNVRFSPVPDGAMRTLPVAMDILARNIEETVGAFKIQMGQDLNGGTATEATIAMQEGNRRLRGLIRGFGDGLEQVLDVTRRLAQQNSIADVEFPVLGKRAIDLNRSHATVNPADLLGDVKFELVGLAGLRNYGMRASGIQMFLQTMTPLLMPILQDVDLRHLVHLGASEWIGPEEADAIIKIPTPIDRLRTQEEENEGLIQGTDIEVDDSDNHRGHMKEMRPLYEAAIDPDSDMEKGVRIVVLKHWFNHQYKLKREEEMEAARQKRMPTQQAPMAPEAGGQQGANGKSSPRAGGMSDAITSLVGGQTPGENPGPPDGNKVSRPGRVSNTMSQMDSGMM